MDHRKKRNRRIHMNRFKAIALRYCAGKAYYDRLGQPLRGLRERSALQLTTPVTRVGSMLSTDALQFGYSATTDQEAI